MIVSVIMADDAGNGHVFPYAQAVGEAARLNGWAHTALVPTGLDAERVDPAWRCALPVSGGTRPSRLKELAALRTALGRQLDELLRNQGEVWLFVDPMSVAKVGALWFAVLMRRHRVGVWLMYRYDTSTSRGELAAYRWLNRAFAFVLPRGKLVALTDSEALKEFLGATFGREMHVLPIPHTFPPGADRPPGGQTVCWWPGKPLANKGRAVIERLAGTPAPDAGDFIIVAARAAALSQVVGGPQVRLLADRLSAEEFQRQMHEADVILLPYDPQVYRRRTSGIFVEAVVAGKVPVVSAGSWSASELERYNLPELAWSDWDPDTVFVRLRGLLADVDMRQRLDAVRRRFADKHSVGNFAIALQRLVALAAGRADPTNAL